MFERGLFFLTGVLLATTQMSATESPLAIQSQEIKVETVQPDYSKFEIIKTSFEPFTGKIVGSKVRIRTKPSLDGDVVRETYSGEMFGVAGEINDFYAVLPPKGMKGYIFRTYVWEGTVEGDRVNVRLFPEMDAPIVGQLNRGEKVYAVPCETDNKWLEIDLPDSCRFYVAKDYCEKQGPIELLAQIEKEQNEANHLLNAAFLFAQTEIQKPFEAIDIDTIMHKFEDLYNNYRDLPEIANRAQEANSLMQEIYVQKKVALFANKRDVSVRKSEISPEHLERLAKLGIHFQSQQRQPENVVATIAEAATDALGLATTLSDEEITDKMLLWQPLEQSLFHLWAATNEGKSFDDFYASEKMQGTVLTGIVEPYNRVGVNNLPGDFVLKHENATIAFLYSTRINLQNLIGKQVTLVGALRPNNYFAFPAYFIHSIE